MTAVFSDLTAPAIADAERWTAHNYHPLPVVIADGEGAWVTDVDGRRYLDCLAGYSALNFGHRHPALIGAAHDQLDRITLTSRAFLHDQFGPFCRELAELSGMDLVLPMNTGAEAVETAIKVARKWGYRVKGVPDGKATIVVAENNFHGRTTTIVSFSTDPDAYARLRPVHARIPRRPVRRPRRHRGRHRRHHGRRADRADPGRGRRTRPAARLPAGHPRAVLRPAMCCSSPTRCSPASAAPARTFACDHDDVVPDMYVLGKALGGGVVPVSAVASSHAVLGLLKPGEHGSTFGGNPLACAVGRAVIGLLNTGEYQERARVLGDHLHARLGGLIGRGRHRRTRPGTVGRGRHRPVADDRSPGVRAPDGPRRTRQGHPRLDHPPGTRRWW